MYIKGDLIYAVYSSEDTQHPMITISKDSGDNWHDVLIEDISGFYLTSLAVDPVDQNVIYISGFVSNDHNKDAIKQGIIYKSVDGGLKWERSFEQSELGNSSTIRFYDIIVHPIHHNTIYAATNEGIFRSEDAGRSWTKFFAEYSNKLQITSEGTIFSLSDLSPSCVYRSSDNGKSWDKFAFTEHALTSNSSVYSILVDETNNILYINAARGLFSVDLTKY